MIASLSPAPPATAPAMAERVDLALSANGRYGVCLRAGDQRVVLESLTLTAGTAARRAVAEVTLTRGTNALPLDDGAILLGQGDDTGACAVQTLTLLRPAPGGGWSATALGEIPALLGGYLLPSPSPAQLGFFVALDGLDRSTVWRLTASPPWAEPITAVPGVLHMGVWLDGAARMLAANQVSGGHRCSGIVIDLAQGSWRRVWSMSDTSTDRIWLYSPRSDLLVVSTNAGGEERLGWGFLAEGRMHFPDDLHRPGFVRRPLALDGPGERLLVHEADGAVSRLFTYTPATQRLTPLAVPPGTISAPATWVGDLLRFRFSAPSQPPTLATLRLGPQPRWSAGPDGGTGDPPWAAAELVQLDGPVGPIEAIVYGGPGWRRSRRLVLALHGGPLSAWRFEFDPLFQRLAAAGIAVVAPNHRGSTGYGSEHLWAALGDWGGPDLADVLHIGRDLAVGRAQLGLPGPIVAGASYGAFLALLAACSSPELWSACIALAPFLSGPSLHQSADRGVRDRIAQLGGLAQRDDATGSRDVLRRCPSLSAPLLLVHGTEDLTVPVEQSRTLARRLSELGRTHGVDFDYVELAADHQEVTSARRDALRQRIVHFCLSQRGTDDRKISVAHRERR